MADLQRTSQSSIVCCDSYQAFTSDTCIRLFKFTMLCSSLHRYITVYVMLTHITIGSEMSGGVEDVFVANTQIVNAAEGD